jgi:hypothetical protein
VAGDVQTLRDDAEKALTQLEANGCRLSLANTVRESIDWLVGELQRLQDDRERWHNRAVQLALSKREMSARLQAAEHALLRWASLIEDLRLWEPNTDAHRHALHVLFTEAEAVAAAAAPSGPEEETAPICQTCGHSNFKHGQWDLCMVAGCGCRRGAPSGETATE